VGGGSAADSTYLLLEAYQQGVRGMCIVLYDPEAVQACIAAGVGSEVSLNVGGKVDDMHGEPVPITGHVRVITDGTFEETEARHMGMRHFNQGPTAVVQTPEGHVVMLTTYRQAPASLHQITHAGIDPQAMQMIVAKGVILPRPAYDPVAARTILVNSPGSTTAKNELFEYNRRRTPLFPFEMDAAYTPGTGPVV
jgi:microcystin degradation protein MlrC